MEPITGLEGAASPALLFDADAITRNLELMLQVVGGNPARLRPHIKTHKCREILTEQLALGITAVKCATISYSLGGPNVDRFFQLI
jgi:D-serine deaminase-like pyridoxal phosphate-dependent protein